MPIFQRFTGGVGVLVVQLFGQLNQSLATPTALITFLRLVDGVAGF